MNKHSPGHWQAKGIPWRPGEGASFHKEVVDARGLRVGEVWVGNDGFPDREEGLANLRLMLRAPELLAVARRVPNFWCRSGGVRDDVCRYCGEAENCPLLKARALLKEIDEEKETCGQQEPHA